MLPRRTVLSLLSIIVFASSLTAQAPHSFQYQAVLRDEAGQVLAHEEVTLEVSILQGSHDGPAVFTEIHQAETNAFGLVNLQVGSLEDLGVVSWAEDTYYVSIVADGQHMGSSKLLSVPYALYAGSSADAFSGDYEDLENLPDLDAFIALEGPQNGDMLVYGPEGWQALPLGEEDQVLAVVDGMPQWVEPPADDPGDEEGTVSDVDGNVYQTVEIGGREWMAENLRTTSYADGTPIPGGLDDAAWGSTPDGAYAVFPHDGVAGIGSEEEMLAAYGALYNFHAVTDSRGLCPAGWHVPTHEEWTELTTYLIDTYPEITSSNVGNALKSCRQINSPLGDDCDTSEHPRWNSHNTHYGTDDFDFGALPGGFRNDAGVFNHLGNLGSWFSSTEATATTAHGRDIYRFSGQVSPATGNKQAGGSIRCIKSE